MLGGHHWDTQQISSEIEHHQFTLLGSIGIEYMIIRLEDQGIGLHKSHVPLTRTSNDGYLYVGASCLPDYTCECYHTALFSRYCVISKLNGQ